MKILSAVASVVLFCGPIETLAQEFEVDFENGANLFFTFCASCHGNDARGNGPMTEVLKAVPPDLTRLGRQNEGIFPTSRAAFRIDGRDPLLSHGGPMPLFGQLLEGPSVMIESETGQPLLLARDIADLVGWLQMIQE